MSGPERINFFEGQRLGSSELRTEQAYFEALFAQRNRALHTAGVAQGLEVLQGPRERSLLITSGMGIDETGRLLLLPEAQTIGVPEELGNSAYVLLTASEQPSALTTESGALGPKRTELTARVELSADGVAPGAAKIVLARVAFDSRGALETIDVQVRSVSGTRVGIASFLQGAQGVHPTLQASRADPDASVLQMNADRTTFQGSFLVGGELSIGKEIATAQVDVTASGPNALSLQATAGTPTLVLTSQGQLGIGVAQPQARLAVAGDVALDSNRNVRFPAAGTLQSRDATHQISFQDSPSLMQVREAGEIDLRAGSAPGLALLPNGHATIGSVADTAPAVLSVAGKAHSLKGGFQLADGVVQATAALSTTVRVGTIIDWWKPSDVNLTLPPQFAICNGQVVQDPASPLHGVALPNLEGMYVRGTGDYGSIGQTGGADTHLHQLTEIPKHTHTTAHRHDTFNGTSSEALDDPRSNDGVDSKLSHQHHRHSVSVPIYDTDTPVSDPNSGLVDQTSTQAASNQPGSFALVKIMRIK